MNSMLGESTKRWMARHLSRQMKSNLHLNENNEKNEKYDNDLPMIGLTMEEMRNVAKDEVVDYEPVPVRISRKIVDRANQELMNLGFHFKSIAVAKFYVEELVLGRLLGTGGFCDVFELSSIKVQNLKRQSKFSLEEVNHRNDLIQSHHDMTTIPKRRPLFAVKMLRRTLLDNPQKFANGAIDLTLEVAYLSSLRHPNIIQIHGVSARGPEGYYSGRHDSFVMIVDYLTETLQQRILHWRKETQDKKIPSMSSWARLINKKRNSPMERLPFLVERLKIASEIACGLAYIHSKRIIYRDLKPSNIGFDINNQVKIFDFGLCEELPADADSGFHIVHKLKGDIGTKGYMSPEITEHKPYNQATDVYSFGIVLYELLTLTRPKRKENSQCVNPSKVKLNDECPQLVHEIMQSSFSSVLENRPTMEEFCTALNLAIVQLESSSLQSKSPIRQSQLVG